MPPETELLLPDRDALTLWRRADHEQADEIRAWDAADVYALTHLIESGELADRRVVVIGDDFGALAVGCVAGGAAEVISWVDRASSMMATRANATANGIAEDTIRFVPLSQVPEGAVDVVIVKAPKAAAALEDQLIRLRPTLTESTVVVGAGMTRHVHKRTVQAFEELVGLTRTTKAVRKARLLLAEVDPDLRPDLPAWQAHDALGATVHSAPGVFAAGRLDDGTAALLEHLPEDLDGLDVIDLGCGNGTVGTVVAMRHPTARLTFSDDSTMAVESARATFADSLDDGIDAAGTRTADPADAASDAEADDDEAGRLADISTSGADDVGAHAADEAPVDAPETTTADDLEVADVIDLSDVSDITSAARFEVSDGLDAFEEASADVILLNPPFHQGRTVGDDVAWRLFGDARRVLRPGGRIVVVGNRHLAYHAKLQRLYGNATVRGSDPSFVVVEATRL